MSEIYYHFDVNGEINHVVGRMYVLL